MSQHVSLLRLSNEKISQEEGAPRREFTQLEGRGNRVKMGVPNCLSLRLSGVILALIIANVSAQRDSSIPKIQVVDGGLSPPYFNLADNRRIYASGNL